MGITGSRTFIVDLNKLTTETSIAIDDFIAMVDITDSGSGKITLANLATGIEGDIDHGGLAGLGDDDHSKYLLADGTRNLGGILTVDSGIGQAIIIKGTSTGDANLGWIGFYDSNGTTRRGWVGDASETNDDIVLGADTGDLHLRSVSGNVLIGTLTLADGSITDSSNAIDFGNEALSTTGTLGCGELTIDSGADKALVIKGTDTGDANLGWIGFYKSDGTTRTGYIGEGSSNNENIYIGAEAGDLRLVASGTVILPTGSTVGNLTLANGSITDSGGAISFGDENLSTTGTLGCGAITSTGLVRANLGFSDGASAGIDATFTNGDAATVTVSGGIITDIS